MVIGTSVDAGGHDSLRQRAVSMTVLQRPTTWYASDEYGSEVQAGTVCEKRANALRHRVSVGL